MNSADFDREFKLENSIRLTLAENAELLERLGSDYDENGIPYWEKWHMTECECGKLKCRLCHPEIGE
jgi:hypothetical protein